MPNTFHTLSSFASSTIRLKSLHSLISLSPSFLDCLSARRFNYSNIFLSLSSTSTSTMGNAFCYSCSPCQDQNQISTDIMQALEGVQSMKNVDELIANIDRFLSSIGREGNNPVIPDSFIRCGRDLMKKFSKRLKWQVCKKCLLSTLDRQTRKVVIDVINQAKHFQIVGIAFSVIAYLWEQAEQVSSNKEQCLHFLRYMSALAKHMKNLDIHLHRAKLDEILMFIVKGTLTICALQMKNNLCRFLSAAVENDDLKKLESQLVHSYADLELEALTAVLDRLPIVPPPSQGEYPHNAVCVEEARDKVNGLLDLTDSSRRVVVIYGVGGIGKTTLATAVFNRLDLTAYHYTRVDMDQYSRQSDLPPIQEQILRDVFKQNLKLNNYTQGREELSKAFQKASKPVFLFIDNGLRQSDLEMLLPIEHISRLPIHSRILLTTRNLNQTDIFRLYADIEVHPHRVDSLSEREAKMHLCHYALGDADRSFNPDVNVDSLLEICGGIPLVLRLVGSQLYLRGNTVSAFNGILEYMQEWQRQGFEGGDIDLSERMVDFVYNQLKKPSKEAFLDIVFFFYDWERNKVADIVGKMQLEDLERAALVTTSTSEEMVKVHDIVRARGRELSEGNRITDKESMSILLSNSEKLPHTKGIWLSSEVEAKHLDLMSRSLRVLSLGNSTIENGRCHNAFEELRFLDISSAHIPIDLSKSTRLVYFRGSSSRETERLSEEVLNLPPSLHILHLHLLDRPRRDSPVSLAHLTSLTELSLENIESCIDQLKSLRSLQLYKCEGFTSIPETLGNISSLKQLILNNISKLVRLPDSLGNLSSLQILEVSYCSMLKKLPDSLGNLSSLRILYIIGCSMLKKLPDSLGNLSSLQILHIRNCSMLEKLPDSLGNLSSLRDLDVGNCSMLESLPQSIGNLSSLQYLHMSGCTKLEEVLPEIRNLTSTCGNQIIKLVISKYPL